ncbi:MAG: DMT family transporter [Thermoplasmatota archaeon]
MEDVRSNRTVTLMAVIVMFLFSSSYIGIVIALREIPSITMAFLRALITAVFLLILVILFWRRITGKNPRSMGLKSFIGAGAKSRYAILMVLGFAVFSNVIPNVLQNFGMNMMDPDSTSSLTSLIQGVGPVFTILLAFVVLKEKPGPWKIAGLLMAVPGIVILTTYNEGGFDLGSEETLGAFLNLIVALSYTVSALFLKSLLNRGGSPSIAAAMNSTFGTILLLPVLVIAALIGLEDPFFPLTTAGLEIWMAMLFISVGIAGVTSILWYRLVKVRELSRIMFFVFMLPAFSVAMGFLVLGENLSAMQILGGVLILIGVGVSQRRRRLRPIVTGR